MVVLPITDTAAIDDDNCIKRTGTLWTATAHIITAVIGSGVLSLAWAVAQLGWIAGPIVMVLFSFINYYTSCLLADCYRSGDPINGKRNYTYMHAVRSLLGGVHTTACGILQYMNMVGITIGLTIASSISMMAVKRSNCYHSSGGKDPCHMSSNLFMVSFGVMEIIISQIPNFHQIWWLSTVAAIMSFAYSTIGLGFEVSQIAENRSFKGKLSGISVMGSVTQTQKIWRTFQALGDIAYAYSFSTILIEIQDTVKCPPSEAKTMKKATLLSVIVTTIFYLLCGCLGYAAFGDDTPGNILTAFGFYNPFWLIDAANIALVVHLVGAYQVFCQPVFAFVEQKAAEAWPDSPLTKCHKLSLSSSRSYDITLFRLVWRTLFVCFTTFVAMLLPFFNDVVGVIGSLQFWPLTVYFPVQMYIARKDIPKWSGKWICLQTMSVGCLLITIAACVGSVIGVMLDLKVYKPFKIRY